MHRERFLRLYLVLATTSLSTLVVLPGKLHATVVRFDTSAGNIDIRMFDAATPLSVDNFFSYANANLYDGSFVHRRTALATSGVAVIQGGGFHLNNSIFAASGIPTFAPVLNEPGISNLRGTLAYAKGSDPNSATSQWFINVFDNTVLDSPTNGEFTVFGRVINGTMSIVDAIYALPLINASAAQNAPGEDFDEIPVFDDQKVVTQNDILNEDAVIINGIVLFPNPDGDYDFDNNVNGGDLSIWKSNFGSTVNVESDGNGNGTVDGADFLAWQRTFGETTALSAATAVPEPTTMALLTIGVLATAARRRR